MIRRHLSPVTFDFLPNDWIDDNGNSHKSWNPEEFLSDCGTGRCYGAIYRGGQPVLNKFNATLPEDDQYRNILSKYYSGDGQHVGQYIFKQTSAQIGDRMAVGATKEFEEIETWIAGYTNGEIVNNDGYWYFEYTSEAVLFKLRWT